MPDSDAARHDDSDLRNIVHAGTTLAATALARPTYRRRGQDVLAAIVLGYEAAGRIGEAITPAFRARGFHGCLSRSWWCRRLRADCLQLDAARLAQAIALFGDVDRRLAAAANTSVAREISCRAGRNARRSGGARSPRGYKAEEKHSRDPPRLLRVMAGQTARAWSESWPILDIITDMAIKLARAAIPPTRWPRLPQCAEKQISCRKRVESITVSRPGFTALTGPLQPDRSDRHGA